jgi:hypothetical protein
MYKVGRKGERGEENEEEREDGRKGGREGRAYSFLLDYMKSSFRWFGTSIGFSFSKYIWEIVKGGSTIGSQVHKKNKSYQSCDLSSRTIPTRFQT